MERFFHTTHLLNRTLNLVHLIIGNHVVALHKADEVKRRVR